MAYQAISKPYVGQLITTAMYQVIRENFAQGIPGKYTAKGQILASDGSQSGSILAAPTNGRILTVNTSAPTKLEWSGGLVPIGMIIIWNGSVVTIPSGWQLCNGTNGTPDLRDRFVVGAGGSYAVGDIGGATSTNLLHSHTPTATSTSANTFAHTHTQGSTGAGASHSHAASITTGAGSISQSASNGSPTNAFNTPTHTHTITSTDTESSHTHTNPSTDSAGPSHSHTVGTTGTSLSASTSILPPYYSLCYIQRLS